jgi:hypothetical protein
MVGNMRVDDGDAVYDGMRCTQHLNAAGGGKDVRANGYGNGNEPGGDGGESLDAGFIGGGVVAMRAGCSCHRTAAVGQAAFVRRLCIY